MDLDADHDSDNDLDVSWIKDQERLHDIQTNYCREPMQSIDLIYIYINQNLYIDKILYEKQVLEPHINNVDSVLKKEILLKLIQSKKLFTPGSKYKLIDIMTYNVEMEPTNIQSYSKTENIVENSAGFFKVLPIIDDIIITPSIFIFHGVNAIYFVYQEVKVERNRHTVKSILKTKIDIESSKTEEREPLKCSQKTTKKVRIVEPFQSNKPVQNKTNKSNKTKRMTRRNIP